MAQPHGWERAIIIYDTVQDDNMTVEARVGTVKVGSGELPEGEYAAKVCGSHNGRELVKNLGVNPP